MLYKIESSDGQPIAHGDDSDSYPRVDSGVSLSVSQAVDEKVAAWYQSGEYEALIARRRQAAAQITELTHPVAQ